jgi:DnaJ-class molecular chaperone
VADLPLIDAAIKTGLSCEFLTDATARAMKYKHTRKLKGGQVAGEIVIDDLDLTDYLAYLNEPWPKPTNALRPSIPAAVRRDVESECHFECAICGLKDNGELAHVDAVADTANNSPDNLVLLCPNHHTKYDLGHKPASNLTIKEVQWVKAVQRMARRRMLRYEHNARLALKTVLEDVRRIQKELARVDDAGQSALVQALETESRQLVDQLPARVAAAQAAASSDQEYKSTALNLQSVAELSQAIQQAEKASSTEERRARTRAVVELTPAVFDDEEVECPHCAGSGHLGLFGDLCSYCDGSAFISPEQAGTYDPDALDEVLCPRCEGSGQLGLDGHICSYCRGRTVVSKNEAESFDPDDTGDVECPHCEGRGQTGIAGSLCRFCRGRREVSEEDAAAYDPDEFDEVTCPHCRGNLVTGLGGDVCAYCDGDGVVSSASASGYDPDSFRVACPHCRGNGTIGLSGDYCSFCNGAQQIRPEQADSYDRSAIDEEPCPPCFGRGMDREGNICRLCQGSSIVTEAVALANGGPIDSSWDDW